MPCYYCANSSPRPAECDYWILMCSPTCPVADPQSWLVCPLAIVHSRNPIFYPPSSSCHNPAPILGEDERLPAETIRPSWMAHRSNLCPPNFHSQRRNKIRKLKCLTCPFSSDCRPHLNPIRTSAQRWPVIHRIDNAILPSAGSAERGVCSNKGRVGTISFQY